ncbi:CHAD domain-containing protein [Streptomyces sp. SMS_SU21]|nr:CHAD domain-containing protein [Streptomyces sp. SMS_SU21]MCA2199200.1 CHAD domain-containing protein [Streptomyces sp. SMS_SU21]
MAQQHPDPADVLARHLRARSTEFLRALRLHRGAATPEDSAEAARALRRAARRISAGLYTFRPALDPSWSRALGPELAWVSGTLSQEDACTTRLARLLEALHHLSGPPVPPTPPARPPARRTPAPDGATNPTRTSGDGRADSAEDGPRGAPPVRDGDGPASVTRERGLTARDGDAPAVTDGPSGAPAEGSPKHPSPARAGGAPVAGPARAAVPAADGTSSTRDPGAPATRPASRTPGAPAPAPADGAPPDVPRSAAPATGARPSTRTVHATGPLPASARRAPTVTATVPAPGDRRPEGEPGAAAARRPGDDARLPDRGTGRGPAAVDARTASRARAAGPAPERSHLAVGAAKAAALLERQLTLARTRAHSAALQALGSARFHAVADQVAVLASEVPLAGEARHIDLRPLADAARERLEDAVAALPLLTAGSPYNAEALVHGLSPDPSPHPQDAPWHQVRLLLRLHRYAQEVLDPAAGDDPRLRAAGEALDRHRDAAEAAAAAAQAGRTPRIAPATAYALGVLHAGQRHEVEAARYAFQRAWQQPPAGTP